MPTAQPLEVSRAPGTPGIGSSPERQEATVPARQPKVPARLPGSLTTAAMPGGQQSFSNSSIHRNPPGAGLKHGTLGPVP